MSRLSADARKLSRHRDVPIGLRETIYRDRQAYDDDGDDFDDAMTAFVDSCLDTMNHTAQRVQRRARPRARKLLRALADKRNILLTTHVHPDPDAAASCLAMQRVLIAMLPADATVTIRFKGQHASPRLKAFAKIAQVVYQPWDDDALPEYDAIVLLDTQPSFAVSPLPEGVIPTALVDHHRGRGRRVKTPFADVRIDVGATASIVFSYLMELSIDIDPTLAAAMLYAIESDIAGAAGQQSELDTVAISGLVLKADIRKLWQMRYSDIPATSFTAFARAVQSALRYDFALVAYAGRVEQVEEAALLADGLLRCEGIDVVLVTAEHDGRMILSLRSDPSRQSAGELMRRLVNKIGDGGGHRTKAGGQIQLESDGQACTDRLQKVLKRRLLRCLGIPTQRGTHLPS
jgi:nanoRNase/pAp phosphatase (c-di-AMP/oligoRNAs hydrolase)